MENKTSDQLEQEILDGQLLKVAKLLGQDDVFHETYKLADASINTFAHLLELWEFALKKGWSADDLIKLANVISALQE